QAAQIEVPGIGILVVAVSERKRPPLGFQHAAGFSRAVGIHDVGWPDLRRGAERVAHGHRCGPDLLQEKLQTEWTKIPGVVAVFRLGRASAPARLELHPAAILIDALPGLFMNELNLRA